MRQPADESVVEFTLRAAVAGHRLRHPLRRRQRLPRPARRADGLDLDPDRRADRRAFRLFSRRPGGMILEANMSQTIGSASSSLASGTIFTIPALFLWGMAPPFWQVAVLAFLGGMLGITAMIPLRRLLIVKSADELPYPEGTACAEVLRATTGGGSGGRWIFIGLAVGAAIKLALGAAILVPSELAAHLPVLPKAELGARDRAGAARRGLHPGLPPVGDHGLGEPHLGPGAHAAHRAGRRRGCRRRSSRRPDGTWSATCSAGEIWARYVRYIGAGAVAAAGIVTVVAGAPDHVPPRSPRCVKGLRREGAGPEDTAPCRAPTATCPAGSCSPARSLVVLALVALPGLLAGNMTFAAAPGRRARGGDLRRPLRGRLVAHRRPDRRLLEPHLGHDAGDPPRRRRGLRGSSAGTDASARAAILTVGTVVCVAASKAGDISQDLKTGYLVGATPARQQAGQFLGAAFACWAVAGTVLLLGTAYTFGSPDLPAPQATLMKTVIDGVLSGSLPWGLVGTGATFSLCAMLAGLPGLAFAVGIYLPLGSLTPIFVGGLVRRVVDARRGGATEEGDPGVLAASGLIAGEGLAGVAIAAAVFVKDRWPEVGVSRALSALRIAERDFIRLTGPVAVVLGIMIVLAVAAFLERAGRSAAAPPGTEEERASPED